MRAAASENGACLPMVPMCFVSSNPSTDIRLELARESLRVPGWDVRHGHHRGRVLDDECVSKPAHARDAEAGGTQDVFVDGAHELR